MSWKHLSWQARLLTVSVFAVLLWAVVYPNIVVLLESVSSNDGITARHYSEFSAAPR